VSRGLFSRRGGHVRMLGNGFLSVATSGFHPARVISPRIVDPPGKAGIILIPSIRNPMNTKKNY